MKTELRVFRTYTFKSGAEALKGLLDADGITAELVEVSSELDSTFSGDYQKNFVVKIPASDFGKAQDTLEKHAQEQINNVAPDYYLFSSSDEELYDMVLKKDEWNAFYYQLAKKILTDRGHNVDDNLVKSLNRVRLADLSKQEKSQKGLIYAGYTFAILGGLLGIFIGYILKDSKKTLPNGEEIFVYAEADREHGKRIFLISIIMLVFWALLQIASM